MDWRPFKHEHPRNLTLEPGDTTIIWFNAFKEVQMAEVFGIVAGAFGACSLALDLLEVTKSTLRSLRRIRKFHSRSTEIANSLESVEQLLTVLGTLAFQQREHQSLVACLNRCKVSLTKVKSITQGIEETGSGNLRNIKGTFKRFSIDERLSETNISLRETIKDLSFALLVLQV